MVLSFYLKVIIPEKIFCCAANYLSFLKDAKNKKNLENYQDVNRNNIVFKGWIKLYKSYFCGICAKNVLTTDLFVLKDEPS